MDQALLIRNGFIEIPVPSGGRVDSILYSPINTSVATIVSNLASYGYTVDRNAFDALLTVADLADWWKGTEKVLKAITGTDRKMEKHIVYKNFPREVLEMSAATQLVHQLLIYWGVPYDFVREEEQPRPPLGDIKRLKVLTLADDSTQDRIYDDLVAMRNRWSDNQLDWAKSLIGNRNAVVAGDFGFKENAIQLAATNFETMEFVPSSGTDVLRLAAALSDGDISLREKVKFRSFKRPERRRLLAALDTQANIADDMATRPEPWKRLMQRLRPGDYKEFGAVTAAYDTLYNKRVKPFSAKIDPLMPSLETLEVAATRPGEFLRRFHFFYGLFGSDAMNAFMPVMDKLTTRQLASLRAYLRSINDRQNMIYAPRGNWGKAQVFPNQKTKIEPNHRRDLDIRISEILKMRLAESFPEGIALDFRVDQIRLQTNDQKLAEYGRGTEFDIPPEMTFLRTASYWEFPAQHGVTWYDNGWNFFDDHWQPKGVCSWNDQHSSRSNKAAIFSGDPVNMKDRRGRACQMIDLYLDRLEAEGVRYGVWNILCYSRKKFSEAKEVLATLQMGEHPDKGKVYEPSRAQMVFPIRSETLANYVAYIDIKRRKLIYMDAALPGRVQSASVNTEKLSELMPAYQEYLVSLPTMLDVLQDAPSGSMPVLYDDANHDIKGGRAFVFRPSNSENSFDRISLTELIE